MVNPRKVYAVDTGLIQAYNKEIQADWGHLFENFVFLELRRKGGHIEYYRTGSGREVDFLVTDLERRKILIQVALDITKPETRSREIHALVEAMEELGLKEALLVTARQEDKIKTDAGQVQVMPAWLWALR
jgi:predicted AAA+ superfamily ATPase